MTRPHLSSNQSRAEKRALWELSRRYNVTPRSQASPNRRLPAGRQGRPIRPKERNPHLLRRFAALIVAVLVLGGGVFGYKILAASNKISVADRSLIGQLRDLFLTSGEFLAGESDGRVNVLLIAVGGEGHRGENLADTIIVASLRPHAEGNSDVAMLSIPRDLYVQVPDEEYFAKINSVHAYGEAQTRNGGPEALRQKVEEITGLPIHYFVRADFTAFKTVVDAVGGVEVTNESAFFDYWHKIDFPAGTEKMNGERSLAYVRARYIEGPEGGDFKRAERQQKVLISLREKVFSVQTAFDFPAIGQILNSLSDNISTDMQLWEMKRFFELARTISQDDVHSVVLTTGPNGVLTSDTEILNGQPAAVLRPRTGDYSEIQQIAAGIFDQTSIDSPGLPAEALAEAGVSASPEEEPSPSPAALPEPTVEIRNGTNVTGLAGRTQTRLETEGYEVTTIGNANNRATTSTKVYALRTAHNDNAKAIANFLSAASDSGLPAEEPASEADVLIILGQDFQE